MRTLTLRQIAARCHRSVDRDAIFTGCCVDSRILQAGQLFFALKGARTDGHDFLAQVAKMGAGAAVVDRAYAGPNYGLELFSVADVLSFLQDLAKDCLKEIKTKVVAVTGSIGKTTTKEFLRAFLAQRYRVAASPGNSNSQIGLPLAILNHTDGTEELLVLEMGMTHPGQISQLVTIAPPDVALLTNVSLAHAGNFDDLAHIARTKAEIFTSPKTRLGLLPRDIEIFEELRGIGPCEKRSFSSKGSPADYVLVATQDQLAIEVAGKRHALGLLPVAGLHNRHNMLAAAATAYELGVTWEEMARAVPLLTLPERRLQVVQKNGVCFINDAYNAPPAAVVAALMSMPIPQSGGRRVAVLGTMPDLGKFSDACHREVGARALEAVDELYCLGKECAPMQEAWKEAGRSANWYLDRAPLLTALRKNLRPGDVVLIKGANTKQMWQLIDEF